MTSLKSVVASGVANIKASFQSLSSPASQAYTWGRDICANMASGISNAVSTVWSGVKNVASSAVSWGKDIISGIGNGIKSGISFVGKAVKGVASAIESFLHFSVPDKDPLADADTYMPDFMKLLTKGITGKKDTVVSRVKDMVTKVKEQMLA